MLLISDVSYVQKYIQKQNADTLYSVSKGKPVLFIDNTSGCFYLVKNNKQVKVAEVHYKYGRERLGGYLRKMYYKDVSSDCSTLVIDYVLIFNKNLQLEKVEIVQCPNFLSSDKVGKLIKRWLSKQKDNWYSEDKNSHVYFYFGRLFVL